jgi:hypothetical protein
VDDARWRFASGDRHSERVDDELCFEVVAHRPADNAAAVRVEDDREKQPALTGRQVGDVSEPQLVRSSGREAATDEVRCRRSRRIGDRRAAPFPSPRDTFQLELAHQPGDPLAADPDPVRLPQLGMHPRRPIGLERTGEDPPDQRCEACIAQCSPRRAALPPGVVAGTSDTEHPAQQGDGMLCFLRVDQTKGHRS